LHGRHIGRKGEITDDHFLALCITGYVMSKQQVIVRLKGGLGNQMFQYAAGRALAIRTGMQLTLDITSGFIRDRVYQRTFALGVFPIQMEKASFLAQLPFWFEQEWPKYRTGNLSPIRNRPWGTFLYDPAVRYLDDIARYRPNSHVWMDGHWQNEAYFADCRDVIERELALPRPTEPQFLSMAEVIDSCNSVAVGVRLFEELPGPDKSGVGGLVPFSFYEDAAGQLVSRVKDPTFFVFCTTSAAVEHKLRLPGRIYYITHENGFEGAIQGLWLISRCNHHILSNSSFYWWGAWLAERQRPGNLVIACDLFPNRDTIPTRWERYTPL
jgi:Glycosyl transferase family 11